jgi:putative DNA primase/helicase
MESEVVKQKLRITSQAIIKDAHERLKPTLYPHGEILARLLDIVQPVDLHSKADVDPGSEIAIWKLVVITVDEIMEIAKVNRWGICIYKEFIYLYNGAYWYNLDEDQLMNFFGDVANKLGVPKLRSRHYEFRKKLVSQFHAVSNMPAPINRSKSTFINLLNGTLEIAQNDTILRPFDLNDFLTYQLSFSYEPEAKAPIFTTYLNTVLPEPELQNILAEYIGYLFIPNNQLKLEKTILLYGVGANGKSVFFDIINALLGRQNVTTYSLAKLTDQNGYYRAMIGNKLVNYASEINRKLDPSFFKQLVSGEPIEARLPYGQPFILEKYAKLIFNTNELPRDVEHSNAYFRRFLIIPFNVTIPEGSQDKSLAHKIIENELPGVLNWVLDGLKRLTTNGAFTYSPIVESQVEQYKNEADSTYLFLDENSIFPDLNNTKTLAELYSSYKRFCNENNYLPFSNRNFKKRLEANGFETAKSRIGKVVYCSSNRVKS